jgi:hypothetical protein
MRPTTATMKGKLMTILNQEDPSLAAQLAECELQDAMLRPFILSFEELDETVDRLESDGGYSGKAAEAARQEIESLVGDLNLLVLKKILLHLRLRAAEKASK